MSSVKVDEVITLNPRRGRRVKIDETITLKRKKPLPKNVRRTKAPPKAKRGRRKGEIPKKELYAKAKQVKKDVGHKVAISKMTVPQLKQYITKHSGMVFT